MSHPSSQPAPVVLEGLESRAYLAAGGLDPSFGNGGKSIVQFLGGSIDYTHAVAVQKDGKIVVCGDSTPGDGGTGIGVARFNADGTLDTSFGQGGQTLVKAVNALGRQSIAIAPDGKIVIGAGAFVFVRLNPNGSLDKTFGKGGTDGDGVYTSNFGNSGRELNAIAIRPDGRVLALGRYDDGNDLVANDEFLFVQLKADGTPDLSFGTPSTVPAGGEAGQVVVGASTGHDAGHALQLLSDGGVLAAGKVQDAFGMVRLSATGQRVSSGFGQAGVVRTNLGTGASEARDLVIQPDGKIVLAGNWAGDVALTRYSSTGVLDTTFGTAAGKTRINVAPTGIDDVADLFRTSDGKLLVVGTAAVGGTGTDPFMARLTGQGQVDSTYASAGIARASLTPEADFASRATMQADGRLVLAVATNQNFPHTDFILGRLTTAGTFDNTFSGDGKAIVDIKGPIDFDAGESIRLASGKFLNVGFGSSADVPGTMRMTRFHADGSIDISFGTAGNVFIDTGSAGGPINPQVFERRDGKIIVAYSSNEGNPMFPVAALFLARFNANGQPDNTFGTAGRRRIDIAALGKNLQSAAKDAGERIILVTEKSVARFNADGTLDAAFGSAGVATLPSAFLPGQVAIAPDGRIVIAGSAAAASPTSPVDRIAVVRLDAAGKLDKSFDSDGLRTVPPAPDGAWEFTRAVAVQADGKILVAGSRFNQTVNPAALDPLIVRLNANGSLDTSFAAGGKALIKIGARGQFNDIAVLPGEKIVAYAGVRASFDEQQSLADVALVRLLPNGQLDPSFGSAGKVVTDFQGEDQVASMIVEPDGRVVVTGRSEGGLFLGRYLGDGISVTFASGTLTVTGTPGSDSIVINRGLDGELIVNDRVGQPFFFDVQRIVIRGLGGDDRIDIASLGNSSGSMYGARPLPTTLDGGDGNDSIVGGPGRDVINGGNGNDRIVAGLGDDTVFAGAGDDSLHGGDGNDYLNGGPGADRVFGDNGNDQIFALDGAIDTIDGGAGFDRVKRDTNDLLTNAEGLLA